MNKHTIATFASLALALTLPVAAQDSAPKNKAKRVEVEVNDNINVNAANDFQFNLANDVGPNFKRAFAFNVDGPGESPLIVSNGNLDQDAIEKLEEDLSIMARILAKAVNRDDDGDGNPDKAMGIHLWTLGAGKNGPRNLYLDGQGAVFILNVPMPLVGSKNKEAAEEKKESSSSSWESARNELYGDGENKFRNRVVKERVAQSFDPARVDALKKNITDSLKNAAHIRDLKPNETVTVVLQGSSGGRAIQRVQKSGGNNVDVFAFSGPESRGGGSRSVMTLRAKKSDIDAYSSGKLDADEFRKKVNITTYQSNPK